MPPKPRFTRETLGSSARPIFTVFRSMEELYHLLFMRENRSAVSFDDVFGELGDTVERCIEAVCRDYDLSPAQARVLFEHVWIYTFGVGALCATRVCRFSEEQLGGCSPRSFRR